MAHFNKSLVREDATYLECEVEIWEEGTAGRLEDVSFEMDTCDFVYLENFLLFNLL